MVCTLTLLYRISGRISRFSGFALRILHYSIKITWGASRRISNGLAYDSQRRWYPGSRAQCGSGHPEGLSHDHRGRAPRSAPAVDDLRPECTRSLRCRWLDGHERSCARPSSASSVSWYVLQYRRHVSAARPCPDVRGVACTSSRCTAAQVLCFLLSYSCVPYGPFD